MLANELMTRPELERRLARRTLALINIPSVSRSESAILALLEREAAGVACFRGRSVPGQGLLLWPAARRNRPLVLLVGHVDTVPEQGNLPGREESGWIHGLGASDMKGGLAVMLELAEWLERERPNVSTDVALLFFAREELPITESAVPAIFAACPELRQANLTIVMEPTDGAVQVGCLGNLNARLVFRGKSAHSARPWQGINALHAAIQGLQGLAGVPQREVDIGGLTYVEVLNLTQIHGGVANNVLPDEVACGLNFRYAPNCTPAQAEQRLRALVPAGAELEIVGNAPPARAAVDNPLLGQLRAAGALELQPKQAWTPVAEFSAEGLDAINYGPGATAQAHQKAECVEIAALARGFDVLRQFLLAPATVAS